jgi:hypothetical protein
LFQFVIHIPVCFCPKEEEVFYVILLNAVFYLKIVVSCFGFQRQQESGKFVPQHLLSPDVMLTYIIVRRIPAHATCIT